MSSALSLHQILDNPVWDLGNIEKFLIQDSSSINERYLYKDPLERVLRDERCSAGLVRLLLRFGAKVKGRDELSLQTAFLHNRDESVIRVLVEAGVHVMNYGDYRPSSLCHALMFGASIDVIRLLLKVGGISRYACVDHGSVMHCAMHFPWLESKKDVLKLLIKARAKGNTIDRMGQSPMCVALQLSPVALDIEHLLKVGFSLRACKCHGSSLLCATGAVEDSCNTLKADVVKLLLKTGASIDKVDMNGHTPLQRALGNIEAETGAIRLLFDLQNVYPNDVGGPWGSSLLTLAIQNQNPFPNLSTVEFLIKQGAQVKDLNRTENATLHLAAKSRNVSLMELLLKHFYRDVNSVNGKGKTPLRVAVESFMGINILQVLLAAGARVEDNEADCLLKFVLRESIYCKSGYFEMLAKHSLLQNPDFDIQGLIRGHKNYKTFSQFVEGCKLELQKMDLKNISQGQSLRAFLSMPFLPQIDAAQFDPVNYGDFNRLLEVVEENAFPIYFDVISSSTKVHRSSMKTKLEEILVYTIKQCPDSPNVQKKVILHYEVVCVIAAYLSDAELLRLVFAFYNAHLRCRQSKNVGKQNF